MKLTISADVTHELPTELMAAIESLCEGLPTSTDDVIDLTPTLSVSEEPTADAKWNIIDLMDIVNEHGMNDALYDLFNDDEAMTAFLGEKPENGEYDNAAVLSKLVECIGYDVTCIGSMEALKPLAEALIAEATMERLAKWETRSKQILAEMTRHYKAVLSKPASEVSGLLNRKMYKYTPSEQLQLTKQLDAINTGLMKLLSKAEYTDAALKDVEKPLNEYGFEFDKDKPGELKDARNRSNKDRAVGTLEESGWSHSDFVKVYQATMSALVAVLKTVQIVQAIAKRSPSPAKQAAAEQKLSGAELEKYKQQKQEVKRNGKLVNEIVWMVTEITQERARMMLELSDTANFDGGGHYGITEVD